MPRQNKDSPHYFSDTDFERICTLFGRWEETTRPPRRVRRVNEDGYLQDLQIQTAASFTEIGREIGTTKMGARVIYLSALKKIRERLKVI